MWAAWSGGERGGVACERRVRPEIGGVDSRERYIGVKEMRQ